MALELVRDTKCVVTVALCARLALLRKVHGENNKSDGRFWDHVDARLDLIRSMAAGDDDKLQAALSGILKQDRTKYGSAQEQAATIPSTNDWQAAVNDALTSPVSVVVPCGQDADDDDNEGDEAGSVAGANGGK
ncbi:hypothetical protein FA15DRAFT_710197 [Coprinopsis marcescibilis]|uniref:Uncharacterized protein n=1 Tax=Coprinopsis marcescibilis TaxID=230819 RepID=A0A5C3KDP5_COPMA|nr:hypothetical protein FA15DRAFT_710197 [Coprinopsis marcescibilis]